MQITGSNVVLGIALVSMVAFAGCQQTAAPMPRPWEIAPTTTVIAPGDWVAHPYEADDEHVLSVTTNVSTGPQVTLLTMPDDQYNRLENGTEYAYIQACSHDWMGNSTISCLLEAGSYVIVLLNDDRPGRTPPTAIREAAHITYSTTGAWIAE